MFTESEILTHLKRPLMPADSQHFFLISGIVFDCHIFSICSNLNAPSCGRMKFGFNDSLAVVGAAQIFLSKSHTLLVLFFFFCPVLRQIKQNSTERSRLKLLLFFFFLSWIAYFLEVTHLLAKHNSTKEPGATLLNHQVA